MSRSRKMHMKTEFSKKRPVGEVAMRKAVKRELAKGVGDPENIDLIDITVAESVDDEYNAEWGTHAEAEKFFEDEDMGSGHDKNGRK